MLERQQSSQEQAHEVMKNGGVVIYWRPGCPYCEALDAKLGDLGNYATWVNIWEDPQAEEHVRRSTRATPSFLRSTPATPTSWWPTW